MPKRRPQDFETYTHCEGCGDELDPYNQRIGSAYHKKCWMKLIDFSRETAIKDDNFVYPEYRWHETHLYIDGKRAKEYVR